MPRYDEHPSKAAAWRDGRFVVLPDADEADETVWFGGPDPRGDGDLWEGLLARRLAPDRAVVCAVPFWAYGVGLGDEVSLVESAEGAPVALDVVRDAGNHTYRVRFEGADGDDDRWQRLMRDLEPFECWFDVRSPGYVAVSAPAAHAEAVAEMLAEREAAGELRYEVARLSARARGPRPPR